MSPFVPTHIHASGVPVMAHKNRKTNRYTFVGQVHPMEIGFARIATRDPVESVCAGEWLVRTPDNQVFVVPPEVFRWRYQEVPR